MDSHTEKYGLPSMDSIIVKGINYTPSDGKRLMEIIASGLGKLTVYWKNEEAKTDCMITMYTRGNYSIQLNIIYMNEEMMEEIISEDTIE